MLERFGRIHDTAKYGTGAFIAFLSFYYVKRWPKLDDMVAIAILQLLIALVGLVLLRNHVSIYTIGTYITVVIEQDSEAKWHRMSRRLKHYLEDKKINKHSRLLSLEDSDIFGLLLIGLEFIGIGTVTLKSGLSSLFPSNRQQVVLFVIAVILFCVNAFLIYQLLCKMRGFRKKEEKNWKKYRQDFGASFPDTHSKCGS